MRAGDARKFTAAVIALVGAGLTRELLLRSLALLEEEQKDNEEQKHNHNHKERQSTERQENNEGPKEEYKEDGKQELDGRAQDGNEERKEDGIKAEQKEDRMDGIKEERVSCCRVNRRASEDIRHKRQCLPYPAHLYSSSSFNARHLFTSAYFTLY